MKRGSILILTLLLCLPALAADTTVPLESGYRAVTIPVQSHQLAYVKAGDRVDVMVTFEAILAKGQKEMVTATLLQNVIVMEAAKESGLVSLMLNPNEAQYAALSIDGKKTVWLARRAPDDRKMEPREMASFRKLFR